MRIAITGTHLVGKTTLAQKLYESFPDYELYVEPYYELEERGHFFSEIPTADEYLTQMEHSIKQIERSGRNAIFDRCPIDLLAYIQATDHSLNLQSIFARIQDVIRKIDLLVYVPVEEPDIIFCRDVDLPELRWQVNDLLNESINDFDVAKIEVKGNVSERLIQTQNKIQQLKLMQGRINQIS